MRKTFELGFVIGRFNHLHDGHIKMIDTALTTCERVLLLVGSSQESGTERNPFNLKTRMDLIRDVYREEIYDGFLLLGHIDDMTNENDHSKEWGDFVLQKIDMWTQHYSITNKVDCMISGNDEGRMDWFDPEAVKDVSQIVIARPEWEISATKMREYLLQYDYTNWRKNAKLLNKRHFENLTKELLEVPFYKEMHEKYQKEMLEE